LGRCPSTISRELRRNRTGDDYHAAQAQREAERRRQERPLVRKMEDPEINETVRAGLAHEWAPEQIEGRMQQQGSERHVSSQTIYAWIKQDEDREHWESLLRRRGKRPYRRKNAATTGDAARIDQRPEVIEERLRLGDFEGDTVLGPAGTGGLATLVDRKSWFTIVVKIQSKNADHVHEKIKQRLKELDEQRCRSITFDNGTEFARRIRQAVNSQGFPEVDHVELFGPATVGSANSRSFVLCPGKAYDRSPCGTGTSAKLACLAADGTLAENERWVQESIIGSTFTARYRRHDEHSVMPIITGMAYVNAQSVLLLDERDPFCWGIRS
jgi:hypothetical protein